MEKDSGGGAKREQREYGERLPSYARVDAKFRDRSTMRGGPEPDIGT